MVSDPKEVCMRAKSNAFFFSPPPPTDWNVLVMVAVSATILNHDTSGSRDMKERIWVPETLEHHLVPR